MGARRDSRDFTNIGGEILQDRTSSLSRPVFHHDEILLGPTGGLQKCRWNFGAFDAAAGNKTHADGIAVLRKVLDRLFDIILPDVKAVSLQPRYRIAF